MAYGALSPPHRIIRTPQPVVSGEAPEWLAGMTPGQYEVISQNTIWDVRPSPAVPVGPSVDGVISEWNGGALAMSVGTHGSMIYTGGGHGGYYGNEQYIFDFATRLVRRDNDPYIGPGLSVWPRPTCAYPDGSPVIPHTYSMVHHHAPTNSFVMLVGCTDGRPGGEGGVASVMKHMIQMRELGQPNWTRSDIQFGGAGMGFGCFSAYDQNRDLYWVHTINGNGLFYSVSPITKQYTAYSNVPHNYGQAVVVDHMDLLLYTQTETSPARVWCRDLNNPSAPRVLIDDSNGQRPTFERFHGWDWSEKRQSILYAPRTGGAVYELKHVTGNRWDWSLMTTSALIPEQVLNNNGLHSRFRIARWGDEEMIVLCNRARNNGHHYGMRIPEAA